MSKKASFLSLRQIPQENSQKFANRVFKKGTILEKSDQDLMIEFIRGLPTLNRFHILTQGTDTFNGATRIATLFETAQTFGQDDSTVTLQQQGTSVKEQNFNIRRRGEDCRVHYSQDDSYKYSYKLVDANWG